MKIDVAVRRDSDAELPMRVADGLLVEVGAANDGVFYRLAHVIAYNAFYNSILRYARC